MNISDLMVLLGSANGGCNIVVTMGKRTYEVKDVYERGNNIVEFNCTKPQKESVKMEPMNITVKVCAEVSSSISKGMREKLAKNFQVSDNLKEPNLQWFAEEKVIQMLLKSKLRGVKIVLADASTDGNPHTRKVE